MINVTVPIIIPMGDPLIFAQKKRQITTNRDVNFVEFDRTTSGSVGLRSVDLKLKENLNLQETQIPQNARIVLKRGQIFHFDIHFDRKFHSKHDNITISIVNEKSLEKIVFLFGSITRSGDDETTDDNFISMKVNIPSTCSPGFSKMEIMSEYYNDKTRKLCQQSATVNGICII